MRENARMSAKKNIKHVPVNDNRNFPSLSQRNENTRFVDAPPVQNFWTSSQNTRNSYSNDLMSPQECLQMMHELMQKLSQCTSRHQQVLAVGEIAIKYAYDGRH